MKTLDLSNYSKCLNPVYRPLLNDNNHRYIILLGGRGSGKSVFCGQKIILDMLLSKIKYLIVRKTFNSIGKSVIPMLKTMVEGYNLSEFFQFNKSDLSVICNITGSEIVCCGTEDTERLKSLAGAQKAFIEEVSELSEEEFNSVDMLLRGSNNHQLFAAFNPTSPEHWLKHRFFDKQSDDTITLKTTYLDNKCIDSKYGQILEKLKEDNPNLYRRWCLGEWSSFEGLIYDKWDIIDEWPETGTSIYGLDWGYKDPTAVIECKKLENNYYCREVLYQTEMTVQDVIKELQGIKRETIIADCAQPAMIEEMFRAGFSIKGCKKGKDSIVNGINWIKSMTLYIDRNSQNLIRELYSYEWEKNKDGKYTDKPIDKNNHILDAGRYASEYWQISQSLSFPVLPFRFQ